MMVPKVKAPWPLLAKSWARALGHVLKTYISNSQEVKRCVLTRQVSCPIWHGVPRCEAAGSGPGRIGLRLCMLIENSQKVNEWKVSLALVTWVTSSHFSPLRSSLANKRRKERRSDRLLWKARHCWPRKKKYPPPRKKELARRRGKQLVTHKLNPWALNISLCLSPPFYQTPRWHAFSKWAVLVEVSTDLFTRVFFSRFVLSHFLTGKGFPWMLLWED